MKKLLVDANRSFGFGAWGEIGVFDAKKLSHQHQGEISDGINLFWEKHQFVQVVKSSDDIFRAPGYNPAVLLKAPGVKFISQVLAAKLGLKSTGDDLVDISRQTPAAILPFSCSAAALAHAPDAEGTFNFCENGDMHGCSFVYETVPDFQ